MATPRHLQHLQRHFSDGLTGFVPKNPSRLNPTRPPVRGTVSMPTSPILRHTETLWEPPQSAQPLFTLPHPDPTYDTGPWFPDTYPSSSESMPMPLTDPFAGHARPESTGHLSDVGGQSSDSGIGPIRKKRAQVRIACTHCQKACKKCSNTRPCDRCVKYGLKDCVDSTRKPRKTGVKRGPYKRRDSAKYDSYYPSSSPPTSQAGHETHRSSYQGQQAHQSFPSISSIDYAHVPSQQYNAIPEAAGQRPLHGYISPPDQLFPIDPRFQTLPQPSQSGRADPSIPELDLLRLSTGSIGTGIDPIDGLPPGPRTAALHGAFASALSGPRWIHGQRTGPPGSGEVMYPPTPNVPFPISLNHRDDPFSRAVSPIHGDLDAALSGLKPRLSDPNQNTSPTQLDLSFGGLNDPVQFTNPFEQALSATPQHAFSAPTSPRPSTDWTNPNDLKRGIRSSSAEPPIQQWHIPHPLGVGNMPDLTGIQSPAIIALKKIRKPSLRTLMSHGGSQAPSRQVSPVPESPTLFDQTMELDEVDSGMDVDLGLGMGGYGVKAEEGNKRVDEGFHLGPFDHPFHA